ncbi:DNA polymerase III epsilon subunit-like 3'-5' exonuclease [Idiomarina sp. A28L]|uniref:3'-5' exonuclease n=1 Tax=Idiomarina sp. A28L TaxID=1036674 RepID=UPI0002138D7B|nr:3'-5' exonuclease [Idiomarina sp. A28L]EGN74451.1 DNA polymerase III epsilon subunit-like 3'-5' exonuclease [Idiomarina sp. A28L]
MFYLGSDKLSGNDSEPNGLKSAAKQLIANGNDWQQRFLELAETAKDPRLKRFYQAGIDAGITNPNARLSDIPLLSIDFETTGFDPSKHGIVSIGSMPLNLQRIFNQQAKQWLAKPRRSLNTESIVIHGITHSQLQEAPDLLDILDELLETIAGHILVVHYRGIERPFLDVALRERIGEGIEFPVIDTMQLEARMHRAKRLSLWQRMRGQKQVSIRLADSRTRYGLPWYHPHDAVTDALATAELLQAQIAHHYSPETTLAEVWC